MDTDQIYAIDTLLAAVRSAAIGENAESFIRENLRHFKQAAASASTILQQHNHPTLRGYVFDPITIIDATMTTVAWTDRRGRVSYDTMIHGTDVYAAVQYVRAAVKSAVGLTEAAGNTPMTFEDVESMLRLKPGAVAALIAAERETLTALGVVDQTTIQRRAALALWGKHGTKRPMDMPEYEYTINAKPFWSGIGEQPLNERVWAALGAREFTPHPELPNYFYSGLIETPSGLQGSIYKHENYALAGNTQYSINLKRVKASPILATVALGGRTPLVRYSCTMDEEKGAVIRFLAEALAAPAVV